MKWLDYPPVWLLAFMALAWAGARMGLTFAGAAWVSALGWALIAAGIVLMGLAAWRMHRHHTTLIPHRQPSEIVTDGVYRLSRNPIYLADAFTLAGFALLCQSWIGLALVPLFMAVIARRFIRHEEERLKAGFGDEFATWAKKTRRWL